MLLTWNVSRTPFSGQVIDLGLLLANVRFGTCCFVPMPFMFTQRPLDDRKIEPAKGRARLWLVTSFAKSIENFVLHGKKKSLTTASFFLYFREIRNK